MPWKLVFFILLLHFKRIQGKPPILLCREGVDDLANKKGFQLQSSSSEEKEREIDVLKSQSLGKGIQTEDKSQIVRRHEEFENTANKIRLRLPSEEEKLEIIKSNPFENDVKIQSNPLILRRHEEFNDANKIRLRLPSSLEEEEEENLEIIKSHPLEDDLKIQSNPPILLSNEEFDDTGNKIRLRLSSSQEEQNEKIVNVLKNQQLEKEIARFNLENENVPPCKHIIVKCDNCEKQKSLIPRFATNNRDLWNSIAEIESLRPSQNSQFGGCDMSKLNSPQIRRSTKAEDEEEEKEKQRRKMYEDFLKFTTVLNKLDEFFTKKTKVFVRGLHTMIESSEEDKNGFHNVSR